MVKINLKKQLNNVKKKKIIDQRSHSFLFPSLFFSIREKIYLKSYQAK